MSSTHADPHRFDRDEVEREFARWWAVGNAGEDWAAWARCFTPDAYYIDHFWGPLRGPAEIDLWIHAVMKGVPEIYGVLDWYVIDGDRVAFHYWNRRDNPSDEGPAYWDFAGMTALQYAGDGLWSMEEDFWDRGGARRTSIEYAAACERAGITDPLQRMTRRHWPEAPAWARKDGAPTPSWLDRDTLPGITRPRELRHLLQEHGLRDADSSGGDGLDRHRATSPRGEDVERSGPADPA